MSNEEPKYREVYIKTDPKTNKEKKLLEIPIDVPRIDGNDNSDGDKSEQEYNNAIDKMASRRWRLNHLYHIIDKNGKKIQFHMNEVQEKLYNDRWYLNLIPKARQHGITTFIDLLGLDAALFTPNFGISIIAHTKPDAKRIFEEKVKFPYESLPEQLRSVCESKIDTANHMKFSNGSSIRVEATGRSGTFQFLHVSEFAKICKDYPEKAREIINGALNTIHKGNIVFIECTPAGAEGYFFEQCKRAEDLKNSNIPLTEMDFKLHFFPWHDNPEYNLNPEGMIIYPYLQEYFEQLKINEGITLSESQKAWYIKKKELLGEDITSEFPSTYDECFRSHVEGNYYSQQFIKMRQENRMTKVPYQLGYLVDTVWDLGVGDDTAIWFTQMVGREPHIINYYENSNEGMNHYANKLWEFREKFNYRYGEHIAPHDIMVRELGARDAETRFVTARNLGIRFRIAPNIPIDDGIEQSRQLLSIAWFDIGNCEAGLKHLEGYKRAWDNKNGCWKDRPMKNQHCHAADAFRYRAVTWKEMSNRRNIVSPKRRIITPASWS